KFNVVVNTKSAGRIVFRLFDEKVPRTAQNFRELATRQHGFGYAQSTFHRIIPSFMIQGGDFTEHNGTGVRLIHGECFILRVCDANSMTSSGRFTRPKINSSQLTGQHAVFGEVVEGIDVVQAIEAVVGQILGIRSRW
ncbi:peptidyl-prolyl cis-trans isomerase, partial [Russula dissimulans]